MATSNLGMTFINEYAADVAYNIVIGINSTFTLASEVYSRVPGTALIIDYIRKSHQNDPFRTVLEGALLVFMLWYVLTGRKRAATELSNQVVLSKKEIEELIEEWEPEPLVPELSAFHRSELEKLPVIVGPSGPKPKFSDGKERINTASFNFLGLLNQETTNEKAIAALRKYGVGSCGPPGFYGTLDVHVSLEKELAHFMGTEAAIIYSQGFSCISSAIPAFAKRGDIIVADEGVSFAIQKGLQISRSSVYWFKHNDMDDLENVLNKVAKTQIKGKVTRKFLVVEGLYLNYGSICPLPKLIELKEKFKYRLIIEESMSFGVLGSRGAGVTDYFDIHPGKVDMIAATMANCLASAGGFCCGSSEIVEHQRLSGQAYTFSASLPAMLAVAASEALLTIERRGPELLSKLQENRLLWRQGLSKISDTKCVGDENSPLVHFRLAYNFPTRLKEEEVLQEIVDLAMKEGVLFTRGKYVENQEKVLPSPSIRICVSAAHSKKEIERSIHVLKESVRRVKTSRKL